MASRDPVFENSKTSRAFIRDMASLPTEERDCLPKGHPSTLPKRLRVHVEVNDVTEVDRFFKLLPIDEKTAFNQKYGKIWDLLKVEVHEMAVVTMLNHWDPSYRCLTFGVIDTTPTIEEYAYMLNLPLTTQTKVYTHNKNKVALGRVAEWLGVSADMVKSKMILKDTSMRGWPMAFIIPSLQNFLDKKEWGKLRDLIALCIYGLILFPSAKNAISLLAADVFQQVLEHKINPVPAILADTFGALNFCRRKGEGKLKCCLQLLFIWLFYHVQGKNYSRLTNFGFGMEFIRKFTELKIVKEDRDFWLNRYIGIDEGNFTWRSHWSKGHGILIRCGDFSYVPLMGTRGCVAYTPTLVLRQFEHLQYIPYTKGLVEMEFEYDSQGSENNLYKVKKAWEKLSFRQEDPCSDTDEAITLYGTWVREKAKEVVVPHAATISHPPPIEVPTRDFEAEFAMKEKLREEEMKRKLDEVEVEKKKWHEERAQLMKRLARAEKEKRKYQDVAQSASSKQIEQMERQIHEVREVAKHRLEQMGCLKAKIEELEENLEEEKDVHKQQMENWENGYQNMKKLKTQEEEDKEFLRCQCEDTKILA